MVSVVMLAYNKEPYLDQAIRGVAGQRLPYPVELLVLDDASTDGTPRIAAEWERRCPGLVRHIRNGRNLGLQRNYIKGFRLARGRYLAVCDADDYWFCRSKLRRQTEYMESHPGCAVTFHRMVNHYEDTGVKSLSNGGQKRDLTIADLSRGNFITNSSVMYRRELVDMNAIPEWIAEDPSPDYAFHMLFARGGTIHYFRRPMGVYRLTAGSSWSLTDRRRRLEMSLGVRERLLADMGDIPGVREGLTGAMEAIRRAMEQCDREPEQAAPRRGVLRRLRDAVTHFLPLPKP